VPENSEVTQQTPAPKDLLSDPDYTQLLEHFQQAEFAACQELLEKLQERYPDHPVLLEFKDELEMKLSVTALSSSIKKGEKRIKRKATLKLSFFAVFATLVVLIAFFLSLTFFIGEIDLPELPAAQEDTTQLDAYYQQAEQLLQGGQPGPAAEIIEKIRAIDPEFPSLADLTARAEELLQLEAQYQAALGLVGEGNDSDALEIFKAIEAEKPGLWDVNKQIGAIETRQTIAQLVQEGDAAFQANNWLKVISTYEEVLKLDPKIDHPLVKEQLLNGYLNQIISLLESETTSLEDIQSAEGYYRKAIALVPQSRAYITERGNLQEVSRDLLFLKFTQIAKDNLVNKNQTQNSVNLAVRYLEKAVELKPENTAVVMELKNAQIYQTGFQNFNNKDWIGAISNFENIIASDPNFANGNTTVLLAEAYYAIAKRYYATSVYPDALAYLEQAEFLVWGNGRNLANLFQIQVFIGDTLGQMEEYEDAVSYYQYALNAIQAPVKVQNFPAISTRLVAAENAVANNDFETAFRAFQDVLMNTDVIFSVSEIDVGRGVNLALFANANFSTLDLVLNANDLPNKMVTTQAMTLQVPSIDK
jgi:tetratricopeptide (TPR) repeat protein